MRNLSPCTYTEAFADIANWTDNFASGTGADRWKGVATNATGTIPDGMKTTAGTTTFATTGTSGGVQRGSLSGNPAGTIVLLATGSSSSTTAAAIDFFVDFSGVNAGTLSFDWTRVNNSTGDRGGSLRVYYSTDGTTFTEITAAAVNNIINNGGTASGSITTVALPSALNNTSTGRLRFYYFNGTTSGTTGSRPKISIDNLSITGTARPEPSAQPTSLVFNNVTASSYDVSFTAAASTDGYVVIRKAGSTPTGSPADFNTYSAGNTIGDGTVAYVGGSTSFSESSLAPSTTYYYKVFSYNGGGIYTNYLTTSPLSGNQATSASLSPTITLSAASLSDFGNVALGSSSSEQSFTISGTNLTNDITITPPSGFQVSTETGGSFSPTDPITLTQTGGSVSTTTIYVKYNPGAAAGPSGNQTIACVSGLVNQTVTVSGTSIAAEPTLQSGITFGAVTNTSIELNFTGGDGARRIVFAKSGSSVTGSPSDATPYNANAAFGSGDLMGTGIYAVYNGTGSAVTVTGLTANTIYHFAVFEYNVGTGNSQNYLASSPGTNNQSTTLNAPTATSATFISSDGFTANWNTMSGATSYRLDVASDLGFTSIVSGYNDLNVGLVTTYNVTGLSSASNYYYRVRAVSAAGSSPSSAVISTSTVETAPTLQATNLAFSGVDDNQFTITWTNGDGLYRIVVVKAGSTPSDPVNGTSYAANPAFKSGAQIGTSGTYVVFAGDASSSVTVTNLVKGTTYYAKVFEYNGTGTTVSYLSTSPASGSQLTTGTSVVSHVVIAEVYGSGGNTGASYLNDYVILYNPTASPVDVATYSIQYASSSGSFGSVNTYVNLTGTIQANSYYSIKMSSGGAIGSALPFTESLAATSINMSGSNGKVALLNKTASTPFCTGSADPNVVDFVGYGTASDFETAAANALSATSSIRRKDNSGACTYGTTNGYDTNNNSDDFYLETNIAVNAPLPVELTGFAGIFTGQEVKLTWSTASEINNFGFEVERNYDGTWNQIAFIRGNGNTNAGREYTFTDKNPAPGKAQYRLKQIDTDGKYKYYDAITVNVDVPKDFKLLQNSPNPFNPSTAIKFQLPVSAMVTIKVYDQIGREVATLVNQEQSAGSHIVYWNGRDNNGQMVSSGMYLYRISAGSYSETRKMNLLK